MLWKAETEARQKRERVNKWVGREDRRWKDRQTVRWRDGEKDEWMAD